MTAMHLSIAAAVVLLIALFGLLVRPQRRTGSVHVPLVRNFEPKERERIIKEVRACYAKGSGYHIWRSGPTAGEAEQNLKEEIEARKSIFPPELQVQSVEYRMTNPGSREGRYEGEALLTFSARQSVA